MLRLATIMSRLVLLMGMTLAIPAIAAPSGKWLAEDIGGGGVLDRIQTTIEFGPDGSVAGSGGCNRFFGKAMADGANLRFGAMGGTRMMCPPAVMTQEGKFQQALDSTRSYALKDGKLELLDASGAVLVRFAAMPAPASDIVIPMPGGTAVQEIKATYACSDQSVADLVYINAGGVSLATLSRKGEFLVLANVLSGSGARYAGGPFIWWSKGRGADLYDLTNGENAPPVATCVQQ